MPPDRRPVKSRLTPPGARRIRKGGTHSEAAMADKVRKVSYYYTMVPNRPGRGAKILGAK